MADLKVDWPVREHPTSPDNLFYSIRNNDLRQPLLVHPESMQVISGFRRYYALQRLGRRSVPVLLPDDVTEACEIVQKHLDTEGPHQLPLSLRERFTLSQRLRELPRPVRKEKLRYEEAVGPAVGFTTSVLKRLRTAYREASTPDLTSDSINARQVLELMFEALEKPLEGWTTGQSVRRLYDFLKTGNCPQTLAEACITTVRHRSVVPAQSETVTDRTPLSPTRRRVQSEIRRGVDTISGACAGLASLPASGLPSEDLSYLEREIRKNRRILLDVLKNLQES
ncbi:ParB N-terminal domain-containing protein [Streptomyces sp. NPDC057197]|uniref:ParB/RepB/Spo0J family partition protein n=1 Tax=Streptomyces sp. NPDC057197 TaxID=3346045 RepID=UPI0036399B42